MNAEIKPLPVGCLATLSIFIISDESGLEGRVVISNLPYIPNFDVDDANLAAVLSSFSEFENIEKMMPNPRLMTADEVSDYLANESAEK